MYNYSIILPYYDKFELFAKAVDSIQDREDIQIIVVDNSKVSLNEQQIPRKQKAKITYVTSDNTKGAGCARNVGLTKVEGKYTLFCDADDYFIPGAFDSFDKYLDKEYDIVFFKSTSVFLQTGAISDRHLTYNKLIDDYLNNGDAEKLRYRYEAPWGKLYRTLFILADKTIRFEEIRVNNDAWFSLMAGHNARRVAADNDEVYMITEGGSGTSLTKIRTVENTELRYDCAIKTNLFLRSVNHYGMRIRLLGYIRIAFQEFGFKVGFRFLRKAWGNKLSIF